MGTNIYTHWFKVVEGKAEEVPVFRDQSHQFEVERRNYCLFALLGDVRNGYGFAGVPIFDDPITPCPHRHLGVHEAVLEAGIDESYNYCEVWYKVADLHKVAWDTEFKSFAYVDRENYEKYKRDEDWRGCDFVSGPTIKTTDDEKVFLKDQSYSHCKIHYTHRLDDPPCSFLEFLREKFPEGSPENEETYVQMYFDR